MFNSKAVKDGWIARCVSIFTIHIKSYPMNSSFLLVCNYQNLLHIFPSFILGKLLVEKNIMKIRFILIRLLYFKISQRIKYYPMLARLGRGGGWVWGFRTHKIKFFSLGANINFKSYSS